MRDFTPSVVIFTNFIAPYRLSLFESLKGKINNFKIFVSIPMEKVRQWPVDWGKLNVGIQKTISIPAFWRHPSGFKEQIFIHFPIDTLPILRRLRPQVVVTTEMGSRTIQAVIWKIIFPATRLIYWEMVSEHTEKGRGSIRKKLRQFLVRFADAFWVNGESGARYMQNIGANKDKFFYIPYTIDSNPFQQIHERRIHDPLRLLMIGQLIVRKGIFPFLDVLNEWANLNISTKIELWIAGEGPLREAITKFSFPANIDCKYLGSVAYKDLPSVYAQGDLFVFPTLADEWGVVVNEAMASGLPVLGSLYSQAVEEMIENGVNGWVFHPDNPQEIALALDKAICTSKEELLAMGKTNQEKVEQFSIDVAVEQMLKSIAFVLDQ